MYVQHSRVRVGVLLERREFVVRGVSGAESAMHIARLEWLARLGVVCRLSVPGYPAKPLSGVTKACVESAFTHWRPQGQSVAVPLRSLDACSQQTNFTRWTELNWTAAKQPRDADVRDQLRVV